MSIEQFYAWLLFGPLFLFLLGNFILTALDNRRMRRWIEYSRQLDHEVSPKGLVAALRAMGMTDAEANAWLDEPSGWSTKGRTRQELIDRGFGWAVRFEINDEAARRERSDVVGI